MTTLKCVACTPCTSKDGTKTYYKIGVVLPNGSLHTMISNVSFDFGADVPIELRQQYIKTPGFNLVAVIGNYNA